MQNGKRINYPPAKNIAYIALMCAILIGGQYVFSFVAGVEIVTLLLACFSYVFGVRRGMLCATAYSLLRCLIFGFYPTVIILYLIYYPVFAAVFGGLGHIKDSTFEHCPAYFAVIINVLLLGICAACAVCFALDLIKVSRIYKVTIQVLLWVIFALCAAGCLTFNTLFIMNKLGRNTAKLLKLIMITSIAAVCTICFTLLDDIITPLFWGYSQTTALAYFYTSFTAMLPQTVCTIVTVSSLFMPLTSVLKKAAAL